MQALQDGDFSGVFLCDGGDTWFRFVGRLAGKDDAYLIYHYRYSYKASFGTAHHRGQRLVVFDAYDERYLGQYVFSSSPVLNVSIAGSTIRLSTGGEDKGTLDFANGPPRSVEVNGKRLTYVRGQRL